MKKMKLISATILLTVLFAGCSGGKITPSTSSSSKPSSTSQSVPITTEDSTTEEVVSSPTIASMDLEAISQGDFSSVIGIWKTSEGHSLTFNSVGLVGDATIQGGSRIVEGALDTSVNSADGTGFGLLMIPSGVSIPPSYYAEGTDNSDSNRDRMFGAQGVVQTINDSGVYYRVQPISSTSVNPLTNEDTGISLESGQGTIDFANNILGNLNWQVIESNYNRTESIPFELLRGDNGSLYRIYRNGVILSETKSAIVYVP